MDPRIHTHEFENGRCKTCGFPEGGYTQEPEITPAELRDRLKQIDEKVEKLDGAFDGFGWVQCGTSFMLLYVCFLLTFCSRS